MIAGLAFAAMAMAGVGAGPAVRVVQVPVVVTPPQREAEIGQIVARGTPVLPPAAPSVPDRAVAIPAAGVAGCCGGGARSVGAADVGDPPVPSRRAVVRLPLSGGHTLIESIGGGDIKRSPKTPDLPPPAERLVSDPAAGLSPEQAAAATSVTGAFTGPPR